MAPVESFKMVVPYVNVRLDIQEMTAVKYWIFVSALLVHRTAAVCPLPVALIAYVLTKKAIAMVFARKV